ncbi:hypothetical protein CR194_10965 [Salipaludibacillus keqinensis]|uniref:Uncharacterized protein n=1 Tax=Salipaludibacillus keqinensis TaxID=2045207 RepID=A0A323TFE8_9BACI|nr:hypothetical protein [Salipaludibacillus keqinensis]PYZ93671.1 hypothetical protein CR194_10965 [Salipaludibacillus keqinensis]
MLVLLLLVMIASLISYVILKEPRSKRPTFTTVKKYESRLLPSDLRYLYDALTSRGYYVSCEIKEKRSDIPLALEPFRIALIPRDKGIIKNTWLTVYLNMKGWKTILFSSPSSEKQLDEIIAEIEGYHPTSMNDMKKVQ